jgi:hypothetical protein
VIGLAVGTTSMIADGHFDEIPETGRDPRPAFMPWPAELVSYRPG